MADSASIMLDAATFNQHKEEFRNFLRSDEGAGVAEQLRAVASGTAKQPSSATGGASHPGQQQRATVDLNLLRKRDPALTRKLIHRPMHYIAAFEEEALNFLKGELGHDPKAEAALSKAGVRLGFAGSVGSHLVSPRGLLSSYLCSLVCVEGIVTKCSLVQPKVVRSVHWCEATSLFAAREYRDATALDLGIEVGDRPRAQTSSVYPTKDDAGNPLDTEFGLCTFKDHQTVVIQEMPERAPLGQLPRSVELVLDGSLVDKVKPGDRVQGTGVYRAITSGSGGGGAQPGVTSGLFKTKVLCSHLGVLGTDIGGVTLSANDVAECKKLGARADVLAVLGRSLAPSVCGHELLKRALVLQLIGGCEKNLSNGTHLRGDINILMVGDPSTAKSQLLRAAMGVAPLAVSTTGRGSSGVGLTAAVTQDSETGERKLEAGAMVLADRGLVCIDEFDKMSDADRVAIHEVMEQQTVTVAKAGIHASLNARCSVLAAANPVYGQYNKDQPPQKNIGLPDSLLSRFDLLFVVLDHMDPEVDRTVSQHVLRGHAYRKPGSDMAPEPLSTSLGLAHLQGGHSDDDDDDDDDGGSGSGDEDGGAGGGGGGGGRAKGKSVVWNKVQPLMYGQGGGGSSGASGVLHKEFLKKFLQYAKSRPAPVLTDEAREYIAEEYASLRAKATTSHRTLPVTARQLETLIRVSSAYAKARLSPLVEEQDARDAAAMLQFALYHETGSSSGGGAASSSSQAAAAGTGGEAGATGAGGRGVGDGAEQPPAQRRRLGTGGGGVEEEEEGEEKEEGGGDAVMLDAAAVGVGGARYEALKEALLLAVADESSEVGAQSRNEGAALDELLPALNAALLSLHEQGSPQVRPFSLGEAGAVLEAMDAAAENVLMYSDGVVTII